MSRPLLALALALVGGCRTEPLPDGGADLATPRDGASPADLAAPRDGATTPPDLAGPRDGGLRFPDELAGIWLIGWAGGLDHYSWVRFRPGGGFASGDLDLLDPMRGGSWTSYWPCMGKGTYDVVAKPDTIQIRLPAGCASQEALTFVKFAPAMGWPTGSTVYAAIEHLLQGRTMMIEGHKFPDNQCDPDFTVCKLPQ